MSTAAPFLALDTAVQRCSDVGVSVSDTGALLTALQACKDGTGSASALAETSREVCASADVRSLGVATRALLWELGVVHVLHDTLMNCASAARADGVGGSTEGSAAPALPDSPVDLPHAVQPLAVVLEGLAWVLGGKSYDSRCVDRVTEPLAVGLVSVAVDALRTKLPPVAAAAALLLQRISRAGAVVVHLLLEVKQIVVAAMLAQPDCAILSQYGLGMIRNVALELPPTVDLAPLLHETAPLLHHHAACADVVGSWLAVAVNATVANERSRTVAMVKLAEAALVEVEEKAML